MIKKPMDLGTVRDKLKKNEYEDVYQAADDVRLVWSNCMAYNADGSDFFLLAQSLEKKWEERFGKLLQEHQMNVPKAGAGDSSVSLEDKRSFAKALYKLSKEELGKILVDLDSKCPAALVKNSAEDEVELNVDKITSDVFTELMNYCNTCQASRKNSSKKLGKANAPKKARTS